MTIRRRGVGGRGTGQTEEERHDHRFFSMSSFSVRRWWGVYTDVSPTTDGWDYTDNGGGILELNLIFIKGRRESGFVPV